MNTEVKAARQQPQSKPRNEVAPVRRDLQFALPADRINEWSAHGPEISVFMNTLSLFFPTGERFFIDSIRHYRDGGAITDPELLKAVRAFIGQEAMHGREHEEYNEFIEKSGLPAAELESIVDTLLTRLKATLPPALALSVTTALEHWTAVMGGFLLDHPDVLKITEPRFRDMWMWHALEETEHKAVAFDVYRTAVGSGAKAEAIRATGYVLATVVFWSLVIPFYVRMMRAYRRETPTGAARNKTLASRLKSGVGSARSLVALARIMVTDKPGFLRITAPDLLAYFRPGFHPWDQDNKHHLEKIEALHLEYAA